MNSVTPNEGEMKTITSYSNWELLHINDNPNDGFNCYLLTAAGLLEYRSVTEFAKVVWDKLSDPVKSKITYIG